MSEWEFELVGSVSGVLERDREMNSPELHAFVEVLVRTGGCCKVATDTKLEQAVEEDAEEGGPR